MENVPYRQWRLKAHSGVIFLEDDGDGETLIAKTYGNPNQAANAALIAAAPETARKLAEAEARIAELVAVLHGCNEWFTLHHSAANIRKPGGKPTPALITIRDAIAHAESQQPRTT